MTKKKFQSYESVTPYDFGAVGDGEADDTKALQDAAAWCTRSGATLKMTPGIFKCKDETNPPYFVTIHISEGTKQSSRQKRKTYGDFLVDIGAVGKRSKVGVND